MGFLVSLLLTDNVCDVPHRRSLGLNSITSHANPFTDTPACYRRCHNILTDHQTASSTVALRVEGVVPPLTQPTRSEVIHARALMLSRLDDSHERSIAPIELRRDELLLPLRLMAGHTTHHGHIGT
ncbi:hypothetical protein IG631_23345 [Alternaria alternata]|nr:hypothetical protein IG631_23345 [Alternaria alternata]